MAACGYHYCRSCRVECSKPAKLETPADVVKAAAKAAEDRVRRESFPYRGYPSDPRPRLSAVAAVARLRELQAQAETEPAQTELFPDPSA